MKILLISPEFVPVWGGIGSYTYSLAKSLPHDCEVHVLTLNRIINDEESEEILNKLASNIFVHRISNASDTFLFNLTFQLKCRKEVIRLNDSHNYDIIHTQSSMPDLLVNIDKLKVPIVTTVHTTVKEQLATIKMGTSLRNLEKSEKMNLLLGRLLNTVESSYYKKRNNIITVSNWYKQKLETQSDFTNKKMCVIHNGVDIEKFNQKCPKHPTFEWEEKSKINILFFSRLLQRKGIQIVLDSIDSLQSKFDVQFIFAGTGDVKIPKKKGVIKLGYVPEMEKLRLYDACDIFVLPSLHENLPISLLEAMACGKPAVASNICGIPEIIQNGVNGMLCRPNADDFINCITPLLENDILRKRISINARSTIERSFTTSIMAKKTYDYYKSIKCN